MMIDPDRMIHDVLNSHVLPWYYWFFSTITWLGSASLWLIVLTGCIIIGRWRKIASVLIIAIAFSTIINEDVKEIIHRVRPGDVVISGYFVAHSYSFPSGHTQTAFVIATVISAFIARRYNVITYLLAAAVGMSRIYLSVHYFTDVVAGAAAGIVLGLVAIYGVKGLGLYDGRGVFETWPRSKRDDSGMGLREEDVVKYAGVILAAGFSMAFGALILSAYSLSLSVVVVMYILILLLPSLLKGRANGGYC